jgi:hypothetical protein
LGRCKESSKDPLHFGTSIEQKKIGEYNVKPPGWYVLVIFHQFCVYTDFPLYEAWIFYFFFEKGKITRFINEILTYA